jgi:hypothetical protein
VSARDDSSDDDWDPEEGAGASDEEDSDAEDSGADGGAKRGRVTAHYIVGESRQPPFWWQILRLRWR